MKQLNQSILLILITLSGVSAFGQSEEGDSNKWKEKFTVNGYVKYMNTNSFANLDTIYSDNLIHNRINFKYYANNNFTFSLDFRNRLFYGETVKLTPNYGDLVGTDNGLIDLSFNLIDRNALVFNTTIDRANVEFNKGNWNVRLGRQRINWGINMAWNPNDLFNAYNFVDFDYQERPGADALRVQYYTGPMSHLEVAYKPGKDIDASVIAGLWSFNKLGYDFQFVGGNYYTDYTIGTGWAGNIKKIGFKGEASYFHDKANLSDTTGIFVSSVTFDYSFEKGVYINMGGLYNSGADKNANLFQLQSSFSNLSAKNLMPTQFAGMLQVSGAFTPIMGGGITTMYLPSINGVFLIPTLSYSILENWDMDFVGQLLFAEYNSKFNNVSNSVFLRLRWSY